MATRARINQTLIELVQGDITQQDTDAIVNAANSSLLGGGGVDGAIHHAAGQELLAETRTLGGCPTGQAKITKGYKLKAKHVIHAVGPVYAHRDATVAGLLASAYRNSLKLAIEHKLKSIAFPSISTGVYSYPLNEAAPIALTTIMDTVKSQPELSVTLVRFVLFDERTFEAYKTALTALMDEHRDLQAVD